jgi:hypothetical protein
MWQYEDNISIWCIIMDPIPWGKQANGNEIEFTNVNIIIIAVSVTR